MNKTLMWVLISVGGTIGAITPSLFGANELSGWSILGSMIGGFAGIWIAYKLSE